MVGLASASRSRADLHIEILAPAIAYGGKIDFVSNVCLSGCGQIKSRRKIKIKIGWRVCSYS